MSKFDKTKCNKCAYSRKMGMFIVCNISGVTGETCLTRLDSGETIDRRGEDYDNCKLYMKGKRIDVDSWSNFKC